MSVFDSILDGISSLGDWIGNNTDSLGGIAKMGARAFGVLDKEGQEKGKQAQGELMRYAALRGTKNRFKPGEAEYGVKNYAPNPAELEAYWGNVLQKFIDTSATGVSPGAVSRKWRDS